jgi:1-acyl-sn-glycerol-3-phosphate acyltransferase
VARNVPECFNGERFIKGNAMKKGHIVIVYILVFWLALPSVLVGVSLWLDYHRGLYRKPSPLQTFLGAAIVISAGLLLVKSIVDFYRHGRTLPVSALPPQRIIRGGIYARIRHPVYLFYTLLFFGIGCATGIMALSLIVVPVFAVCAAGYAQIEEKILLHRFGDAWKLYRTETGFFFPRLYRWVRCGAWLLCKCIYCLRIQRADTFLPKPPCIVVSTHRNYLDPFMISTAFDFPIHFLTTYEMFRSPVSAFLFGKMMCIARRRFRPDISAARKAMRIMRQGGAIGMFPEGERSWTGAVQPFKPEALKLILKCHDIPIVPVRIEGNYHAWPRWASGIRRAHVQIRVEQAMHVDPRWSLERLEQELLHRIAPRDTTARCRCRSIIHDLPIVIYRCPVCRTLSRMSLADINALYCLSCKTVLTLTPRYELSYTDNGRHITESIDTVYRSIRISPQDVPTRMRRDSPTAATDSNDVEVVHSIRARCTIYSDTIKPGRVTGTVTISRDAVRIDSGKRCVVPLQSLLSATVESNCRLYLYDQTAEVLYAIEPQEESVLLCQDLIAETAACQYGKHIITR